MKAAFNDKYGPPEQLRIIECPQPVPGKHDLLVRVHVASVNRTDAGFLRAKPAVTRLFSGLRGPRVPIMGCDFAGEVVATGEAVSGFAVGDKVFGFDSSRWGSHAEYKVMDARKSVTQLPEGTTYETAGGSLEGGHYALCYVRAIQKLGAQRVLVHGATGAIGSAAVQLLKHAGMHVTATSTTKNVALVKSLGADAVIDWEQTDFTACGEVFDVVFDAVGKSTFWHCKPLLRKGGVYIPTELGPFAQNPPLALIGLIAKVFSAKRVQFPVPIDSKQLIEFLRDRIADGSYKPVYDKSYPLEQIADAYTYVESSQKTGNVVIEIP